ncbi:MAG: GGDEF domain-containing protein [Nautiliaceae bacterium]
MEEIILKISQKVLEELKKAHKAPYPFYSFYYRNVFVELAKKEGIFDELNPKLMCIDEFNEEFLNKTALNIKEISTISKEIKEHSKEFVEKIEPIEVDEIKALILKFSGSLIDKINKLEHTICELEKELNKAYKELLIDPLTRVYNSKALRKFLNEKINDSNFILAIVDLDEFKKVNEIYGHLVGDFVLIKIAEILKNFLKKGEIVCRYGGNEFVIIFNCTSINDAKKVMKNTLEKINKTSFKYKEDFIKLSLSGGMTVCKKGYDADSFLQKADEALREAKKN